MPDQIETPSVKQSKAPLYISLAIIAALVLGYFFIPQVQEFLNTAWEVLTSGDKQRTREWVSQFGWFGPIVIVVTMILQMFLLVIPTPLLMVVTVLAYGPWAGAGILFVAVFMASSIGYFIGRYFGPVIVEKLVGHKTEKKIADFIDDYGFWTVIVVRLSPFLSNDAISFVGGVLKMGYWKFIGATMIGISPLIVFIAYLGGDYERLKTGLIWTSIISLVLFIGFVWWDKKVRTSKA
ncbi:TVP38/TMEM64 family protein [Salinimicrobium tongyeongense]|uniref:TVP38/TMEM64 family membrane protein n=1 Tax=Salinimicrobium tongyeongense TaxID=2809707 RepID=A0ABY6NQK7_9FLAO|nr:TVP38/TMEM64 family protein [Salinimicrobium tongyeongense]UZH55059.1 TVP38/TMEM64 family protein [Salinimicrobium tongyeongense]